ncbi:MAG: hypothetical protein WAQ24_04585 [Candidatus Saccharimonadales bacterium]
MAAFPSSKQLMIDKANTTILVVVSVAAFLVVFTGVACKTLMKQYSYQQRIISGKRTAIDQIRKDIEASKQLNTSYQSFIQTSQNAIGGNPNGVGQQDGNNAKIVLDALPSRYDFPALTTSLETLVATQNVKINSIAGVDEEVSQSANRSSITPQPVPIPFQLSTASDYEGVKRVIEALERSIRPIKIKTIDISGNQRELTLSIDAETYYQTAKSLNIRTEVQK